MKFRVLFFGWICSTINFNFTNFTSFLNNISWNVNARAKISKTTEMKDPYTQTWIFKKSRGYVIQAEGIYIISGQV